METVTLDFACPVTSPIARTASAVMTTIVSGDASLSSSKYEIVKIIEMGTSLQKPHRFHSRHDPVEQHFGIQPDCKCREHQQASATLFRGGNVLLFIPIGIQWHPTFLQVDTSLLLAEERLLQGTQGECSDEHHARARDPDCERVCFPCANENCDLGRESTETGYAHRGGCGDDKRKRGKWQRMAQVHPGEYVEFACMCTAIDHASGDGKQKGRDHAVREHLQYCP